MTITNAEMAAIFYKLADLLEIKGDNPFKIIAYRNAARTIENNNIDFSKMLLHHVDLSALPTIGESIAKKIQEIIATGKLAKLEKLQKKFPSHLLDLLNVEGIGPKRTKILYEKLHISSLEDLRCAAAAHKIRKLEGFDEKLEEMILKGTILAKKEGKRFTYAKVMPYAKELLSYLKTSNTISRAIMAGSFRRKKESVGDLDILITSTKPKAAIKHFTQYHDIQKIISKGETKSTIILKSNLQVDLRCVKEESYGAALHYFTGSKSHNIAIRKMAIKKDLKVNEYGIFKGETKIAGKNEKEFYKYFKMPYIEPELRENRGELKAAQKDTLPKLITQNDIKGDLHTHSRYSDGTDTILEMAKAAKTLGYSYFAVTDHSKHLSIANGMDEKRLRLQLEEIDKLNEKLQNFTILKSLEVDILEDGTLDMDNMFLKQLDLVVGAIHDHLHLSQKKQTSRILKAMDNPYFTILAHPTGRLIGSRAAYAIDIKTLAKAAKKRGIFLEINAQPERMDLNDVNIKIAKEIGVKFAISTDAHNTATLNYMKYGINQARRGWLEKKDVINTFSLHKLRNTFKRI
jgi:DNA polymerase (family 10)